MEFMRKQNNRKDHPRILCLTQDTQSIGGIGNYFKCLYPHFNLAVDYLINGTRLSQQGFVKNLRRFFRDYVRFYHKIRRYDLILINTSLRLKSLLRDMIFNLLCRVSGTRRLVFIHGWNWAFAEAIERLLPGFIRFALFRADAIAVLALEFENALRRWGYRGPVYRLTTFVDEHETAAFTEAKVRSRARKPGLRILFLARLDPGKGLLPSLNAVNQVKKRYPDVQLDVAGIGPQLQRARSFAQEYTVPAVFHGFVRGAEKIALLQKADVLLLPTTYGEGMPTSILEGMAFGCAVITCPAGGIKDFFEHGKMGFLCSRPDPGMISDFLIQLAADQELRIRMGLFNFNYSRQHFTVRHALNRLEKILTEMA